MQVNMCHRLASVAIGIHDETISRLIDAQLTGNALRRKKKSSEQRLILR